MTMIVDMMQEKGYGRCEKKAYIILFLSFALSVSFSGARL